MVNATGRIGFINVLFVPERYVIMFVIIQHKDVNILKREIRKCVDCHE